jgi:hypothetical protein
VRLGSDTDVDHLCGNTLCWSPDHLEAVSSEENRRRAGLVKLTSDDVVRIRERSASGETGVALAAIFGVTPTQISYIINRKQWRNVP